MASDDAKPLNKLALADCQEYEYGWAAHTIMIDGEPLGYYLAGKGQGKARRYHHMGDIEDYARIAGIDYNVPDVNWNELDGRISVLANDFNEERITVRVSAFNDQVRWSDFLLDNNGKARPFDAPPLSFAKDEYLAFTRQIHDYAGAMKFFAPLNFFSPSLAAGESVDIQQMAARLRSLEAPVRPIVMKKLAFDKLSEELIWGRDFRISILLLFSLICGLITAMTSAWFLRQGTTETFVCGLFLLAVSCLLLLPPVLGFLSLLFGPGTLVRMTKNALFICPNIGPIPWHCIEGCQFIKTKWRPGVFIIRVTPGFEPAAIRATRKIRLAPGEIRLTLGMFHFEYTVARHTYELVRYSLAVRCM